MVKTNYMVALQWRIQGAQVLPPSPRNALGAVNSSFFPEFRRKWQMVVNFPRFYLSFPKRRNYYLQIFSF